MRKREQYKKPKFQNKLPTLLIMSLALCAILFFGKQFSWSVAGFFAPRVAVPEAELAVKDGPSEVNTQPSGERAPSRAGTVVYQANQGAAQKLLPIVAGSH